MLKYNLFFLVLIALVSCKSKNKPADADSVVNGNYPNHQSAALMQQFKPFVQGVWVKKSYIDKTIRNKSPLAAQDETTGLTTFYIETANLKGDSIIAQVGWGNHEGGEITLKFTPGKTQGTIVFGAFDLGYSVKNGDTSLVLYYNDKEKNEHTTTWFTKALDRQSNNLGNGMDYLINKGLVAGNYKLIDSAGNNSTVTFTERGKVNGLENFISYFINNDFDVGPMNNLDEIGFNLFTKPSTSKSYNFKISRDTLRLYDTKVNADSSLLLVDKLRYTLVRQN